jgi:hypothetical protein
LYHELKGPVSNIRYLPGTEGRWTDELTSAERIQLISEIDSKNRRNSVEPSAPYKRLSSMISESLNEYDAKDLSEAWRLGNSTMKEHWDSVHQLILKERSHRRVTGKNGQKSPWTFIPNVSDAKIIMGVEHPSLDRRVGTRMESEPYKNKGINKYMKHMVRTLEKNRGKKAYWVIAEMLLKKSHVFRLAAINHVYPTWYKTIKYKDLKFLVETLEGVMVTPGVPMDFTRFYVKKANGKLRPIGAPDPIWRIVLHMANALLVWFYEPKLDDEQHAYRPGRGTGTAWRSIISEKMLSKPYLYEYDLKGFFDNVKVEPIMKELERAGMPKAWTNIIHVWHSKKPKPASWLQSDEMEAYEEEMKTRNEKNWEAQKLDMTPGMEKPWLTGRLHKISFAQGSPMAPTLSIIGKSLWVKEMKKLNPGAEWIIYADDGMIASNQPIKLQDREEYGIYQAHEKSGYIKEAGEWKKNIQFLGLNYDWKTGVISINSRSGIKLTPAREELETILELRKNMMPKLMDRGKIRFEPLPPTHLKVSPPLPWKAYHIHKNLKKEDLLGGFGVTSPDSWKWSVREDGEERGYFEWMPEVRPEAYSGEIELKQLSETKLWDWYYSRGFNAGRRKANNVLSWDFSSMIAGIMKKKRRYEPRWKNLINASSISNWRLLKMLRRERNRRYQDKEPFKTTRGINTLWNPRESILKSSWLPPAESFSDDRRLWLDLTLRARTSAPRRIPGEKPMWQRVLDGEKADYKKTEPSYDEVHAKHTSALERARALLGEDYKKKEPSYDEVYAKHTSALERAKALIGEDMILKAYRSQLNKEGGNKPKSEQTQSHEGSKGNQGRN